MYGIAYRDLINRLQPSGVIVRVADQVNVQPEGRVHIVRETHCLEGE